MSEIDFRTLMNDSKDVVIPDGDYVVIVSKAEATRASTGKPMIKLQLTVADGPKRDRKLFTQITLAADNPFALQRWFKNLACFGLDAAYFNANPTLERIADDLLNRGAIAVVGHRPWEGTDRNEVKDYRPYAPTGPVPPGMILGAATMSGPKPPTTQSPSTPPVPPTPSTTSAPASPSTPPPSRPF